MKNIIVTVKLKIIKKEIPTYTAIDTSKRNVTKKTRKKDDKIKLLNGRRNHIPLLRASSALFENFATLFISR